MIRIILFLVIGLVSWLMLTSHQQLLAFFNLSDSNNEVVSVVNEIEDSAQTTIDTIDEPVQIAVTTSEVVDSSEVVEVNEEIVEENEIETKMQTEDSDSDTELQAELSNETLSVTDEEEASSIDSEQNSSPTSITDSSNTSATQQTTIPPTYSPWATWGHPGMFNPMANTRYMNMMNPMFNMMVPMMSMMNPMMNPAMYMNPRAMMQHPINIMTQPQTMNSMMRSMDPQLMFSVFGQPSASYQEGNVPDQLPVVTIPGFPTQTYQNWPRNKMSPGVSREAKKNAFQTAMAVSPLSMRDMLSIMADKIPVAEDVSWDDAVEAMKLRANEVNFKFVGSSPLWKEIEAVTGQPSAKVEMFRFCDAEVARNILDEIPEFIVFLPCKIALIEDAEGKLWVMTLDWDVSWLDYAQNPNNHLAKSIREDANRIRENLQYIMEGAATGDF